MKEPARPLPPARPRFKRYPAYKDSGVEWLGEVPAAWGLKRLKRIVQFRGGGTPAKDNMEYWRGEIPWVSPKDMKVSVVLDTEDKITAQAVRDSATNLVPAGAVLIVVRSGILVHSIPVALTGREVTLNQDLKALIPSAALVPAYLMYLVSGMQRELLAEWKKEGATVESLELELVASTPTPLPAIAEQNTIAAFLDRETARIDTLVAKKERLVELLQEKRAALITRAVTKGLDPNVPMKDSGVEWLGEIPAHWEVTRLGHLAAVGNGSTPSRENPVYWVDGSYPWLTSGKINEEVIIAADEFVTRAALRECHLPRVRAGSLLVAITGEGQTRGRAALLQFESAISQHLAYVTPRGEGLRPNYLRRVFHSRYEWLRVESSGGGSTRGALTCEFLRSMHLAIPPADEQHEIAAVLDRETVRLDALVAKVRDAIERLKELRTALISAAVTGKIDVRAGGA